VARLVAGITGNQAIFFPEAKIVIQPLRSAPQETNNNSLSFHSA
jgi:hypothetical protein